MLDRQGQPVAAAELFQAGDGPKATSITTDAGGRFLLGGFHQGPVLLFARASGFRFHGQLVKTAENDVVVELTRTSEQPSRSMKTLPGPIPYAESRTLARRLVEPLWETAAATGDDPGKARVLSKLADVDPARVFARLSAVNFQAPEWRYRLERELVLALAPIDFEEASAVAESIDDAGTRSWALVHLVDRLPAGERTRKLALLDRALLQAKLAADETTRLLQMGEVAERWHELHEVDKAKALFAEALPIARRMDGKTEYRRGLFGARLLRVDRPAALEIARDFEGTRQRGRVLGSMALRLVEEDPAEAERIWGLTQRESKSIAMDPTLAWKMAQVDPARRAERLTAFCRRRRPLTICASLWGRKHAMRLSRAKPFERAWRRLRESCANRRNAPSRSFSWRSLNGLIRRSCPRFSGLYCRPATPPATHVPWARVPGRASSSHWRRGTIARLQRSCSRTRARGSCRPAQMTFPTWAPISAPGVASTRAAVARLEQFPFSSDPRSPVMSARVHVAEVLALPDDERWNRIWREWNVGLGGTSRDF